MNRTYAKLMTRANAIDVHYFVCRYVAMMTARKADRELCDGYQVKETQEGKFTITWHGQDCGHGEMNPSTCHSWFARLPLSYWAAKAHDARHDLFSTPS